MFSLYHNFHICQYVTINFYFKIYTYILFYCRNFDKIPIKTTNCIKDIFPFGYGGITNRRLVKRRKISLKSLMIKFLRKAVKNEPKQMLKLLIKKIILYDDKVEIYFNYVDNKEPDDFEHQALSLSTEDMEFYVNDLKYKQQNFMMYLTVKTFI